MCVYVKRILDYYCTVGVGVVVVDGGVGVGFEGIGVGVDVGAAAAHVFVVAFVTAVAAAVKQLCSCVLTFAQLRCVISCVFIHFFLF